MHFRRFRIFRDRSERLEAVLIRKNAGYQQKFNAYFVRGFVDAGHRDFYGLFAVSIAETVCRHREFSSSALSEENATVLSPNFTDETVV